MILFPTEGEKWVAVMTSSSCLEANCKMLSLGIPLFKELTSGDWRSRKTGRRLPVFKLSIVNLWSLVKHPTLNIFIAFSRVIIIIKALIISELRAQGSDWILCKKKKNIACFYNETRFKRIQISSLFPLSVSMPHVKAL